MSKITHSERFIFVDLAKNHNKFWNGDLYDDGKFVSSWGRVVERNGELVVAGIKEFSNKNISFLESKVNEKIRKGYTKQRIINTATTVGKTIVVPQTNIETLAVNQIKYNKDDIAEFIKYLCQTNVHNIVSNTSLSYDIKTGSFSTAIGLITSDGINEARKWLADINNQILRRNNNQSFEEMVNNYLRIIPQDFGRTKKEPSDIFPNTDAVKKQNDVLDGLEASLTEASLSSSEEIEEKVFDTELELLEDKKEIERITQLFRATSKTMHYAVSGMKINRIFIVKINPMVEAFNNHGIKLDNRKELWHGSSISNVLSILKSGIKVSPPSTAAIAGKNFGHGAYFAPSSTKSLQYSKGVWSGNAQSKCYLFLNDVALGNYYVPKSTTSSAPPTGYDSYWAKSGETGYIQNDEIVVFKESQIKINYLIELE